jgi:hypothetical protein
MNTHKILLVLLLMVAIGLPLAGCEDNSVSPCLDCNSDGRVIEIVEQSFVVGDAATVTVDNFVGRVTYRPGKAGTVRVKATKRVAYQFDLERIGVEMIASESGVEVRTENPDNLKRASVNLEITAPANARPRIDNGIGDIDYRGRPRGFCRFSAGIGSVTLRLDADAAVTLELTAGVGTITLGLPVEGVLQPHRVSGWIGNGNEGSVQASTAVGSIYLVRR